MAQINPTRMELTRLKRRLRTASRGHKLLKDKRDEMVRRFIDLVREQKELREACEAALSVSMRRMAAVRAKAGESQVTEALIYPIRQVSVETSERNLMSVRVPSIRLKDSDTAGLTYSFAFTPPELDESVLELADLMPKLIALAEREKTCNMLADEIEKTRRRVNALEHVLIPRIESQIRMIHAKLDENERANNMRLMKVKDMIAKRD